MKKIVLFMLVFSSLAYSTSIDTLKNKMKKIDSQIEKKNTRILTIDSEKVKISKQISSIENDIKEIEKDIERIKDEIRIVNRNIDYGSSNLKVSSKELERKQMEYQAKILAWNRKIDLDVTLERESIMKREFSRMLYGDLEKMEHIKVVTKDIQKVKGDIEKERQKLRNLQNKMDTNKRSIERKVSEKNSLIKRLNNEKVTHVKTIGKLQLEKKRTEQEIEKIIKARAKSVSNVKLDAALLKIGRLKRPVDGKVVVKFKQKKQGEVISNGIEILARMGSKVCAATNGKVIYADRFQGLNNVVMIDYGYNTIGVYGNLISTDVRLNQEVKKGQNIGVLGLTTDGESKLYYEVRFKLKPINPEQLF